MFCWRCGARIPDGVQQCGSCGQMLAMAMPVPVAPPANTSNLAIAAFLLSVLTPLTCGLTILPALILGTIALVKIGHSAGRLKGSGLAIAGICVPIVLLPITMGILAPALARVRQLSFRMTCGENLHSLGLAMRAYAADNNGQFPTSARWCDLLAATMNVNLRMFQCRGAGGERCNYALNKNIDGLGFNAPGDMVLLFESRPGWNQAGGPEILTTDYHQQEGCNVTLVNGSTLFMKGPDLAELRWTVDRRPP